MTVSPDRVRGISGHGDVTSPWTGATQAVQWNQAGSVYGCWSEEWRSWLEPATWSGTGDTTCLPTCTFDLCGQDDGCGGFCPSTDVLACGKCGNASCDGGSCERISEANIGSSTNLTFTVTGTEVTVLLSGGTGDADLYVKLGSAPTTSNYDCRSWATGNDESCAVSGTGTFYILIHAYSPFSGAGLIAEVDSCGGGCVPICDGDHCGQDDGCGGSCPADELTTCGLCGNDPCGGCVPTCAGDLCGQDDGCGGSCPADDLASCGLCGNPACGGECTDLYQQNLGSSGDLRFTLTGTDVAVLLSGGSGDADLYVELDVPPTTSSYGCRSWTDGNNESCDLSGTGTFHILIHAYSTFSGVTLDAAVASCDGGGTCVPSCAGDLCGQNDGCGGTCSAADAATCGMCGNPACGGDDACFEIAYSASGTNSASYTDSDTVQYEVDLVANTSYTFSTCASSSDTYLRLHSGGSQVAANDDGCPTGYGSRFSYTPTTSGVRVLSLGCYYNNSCSATVAISPDANSCTAY